MCTLRINKTKPTSGNAFIVDIFAFGDEKNKNMMKQLSFGAHHRVLTCLLTLSLQKHMFFWTITILVIFGHFL